MKSSGSVFAKKNPFTPASSVRRAHHPSCKQSLSKKEKPASPVHPSQRSRKQRHSQNRESQQLQESHDDGDLFREIWPTPEMLVCELPARPETSTVFSGVQDDSVIAKYIERFRHGQPQSREKRQQVAGEEQLSFWWMSNSSVPSSTPTKASNSEDGHDSASYSPAGPHQHDRSISVLSDSSQGEFDDTEILRLQEKAKTLLLRGAQRDGSIPVSSDGLGCSDFSSPVTSDEPVPRPLMKPFVVGSDSVHAASSQKSTVPVLGPPTRPEEDILFQWRLRRKMEQARDWSQSFPHSSLQDPAFNWQAPSLIHPSTSGQPHTPPQFPQRDAPPHIPAPQSEITKAHRRRDPDLSPPPIPAVVVSTSSPFQPHIPAHMHLLCDVLPCPIQSSHAKEKLNIPQRLDEKQTKVIHQKVQVPERSSHGENGSSSPHVSRETVEEEAHSHQKVSEKSKRSREADRKQRKASRGSSHHRLPSKVTPLREQHQQEGSREVFHENEDPEALPSPVHAALGQVVSEVLFPVADSSPAQKIQVSSVSLPHTVSTSSHSPPSACATQNSLEVISQLLQEGEDSDEQEFEDDPLLNVLRQQRKWVRDQISELDLTLSQLPQEQHLNTF